jgi:hypothetical protein
MYRSRPARHAVLFALLSATGLCLDAALAARTPTTSEAAGATHVRALLQSPPLDVALYDRTRGRMLPLWLHDGALYVAGEPGHEYEIRLRSATDGRVLAVTSVDGVNVVTGETASPDQRGYVIDAGASGTIDGWRKDLGAVASFVFTTPRRAYATRTGRPDDVGVIGLAMFREARDRPAWFGDRAARRDAAAPPPATAAQDRAAESAVSGRTREATAAAPEPRLGTGHGGRRDSPVTQTAFERAGATPDAVVTIYYDSLDNLVARGIVPVAVSPLRRPEPFPAGRFVPDP